MGKQKKIKRLLNTPFVVSLDPQDELGKGSFGKVFLLFTGRQGL